jgi:hypothetical protein
MKLFRYLGVIFSVFIVFVIGFISGLLVSERPSLKPWFSKPKTQQSSLQKCVSLNINNYEIANAGGWLWKKGRPLAEFQVDLKGDGHKQLIRVYDEAVASNAPIRARSLPVTLKVFSGSTDCFVEEFKYDGVSDGRSGNELGKVEVKPNFWGDGKTVLLFSTVSTGYGSGFGEYMNFLTYRNNRYLVVKGPTLGELSAYKFVGSNREGREILVASSIWESGEAHFSPHRYSIKKLVWNGDGYDVSDLGTTRHKYGIDSKGVNLVDKIMKTEPELFAPM